MEKLKNNIFGFLLLITSIIILPILTLNLIENTFISQYLTLHLMIITPGYFATSILFTCENCFFLKTSLTLIFGAALQFLLSLFLLIIGFYDVLSLVLITIIFSIILFSMYVIKNKNTDIYITKKSVLISTIILIVSIIVFLNRFYLLKNQIFISDRFAGPVIFVIENIAENGFFELIPYNPPFTPITHSINQGSIYFAFKILNATIMVVSHQSLQNLLHVPIFSTFSFSLVLAGVSELLGFFKKIKHSSTIIFLLFLFIPDSNMLKAFEVTEAGIFAQISFCIIFLSLGIKFHYLYREKSKTKKSFLRYLVIILVFDFFLIMGYWSHAFYLWTSTMVIIALYPFSRKFDFTRGIPLYITNFLVMIYQILLFVYIYEKQQWSILPFTIFKYIPNSLLNSISLVLIPVLLYSLFVFLIYYLNKIIRKSKKLKKIKDNIQLKFHNLSIKLIYLFEILVILIVVCTYLYFRFSLIAKQNKAYMVSSDYTTMNSLMILRIIEYVSFFIMFILSFNLAVRDFLNKKNNDILIFSNSYFLSLILGFLLFTPLIVITLGGVTVVTRAMNYLLFILILVSLLFMFKHCSNLILHKGKFRLKIKHIFVTFFIVSTVSSVIIVNFTLLFADKTSIYNDEFNDLELISNLVSNKTIYTDNRLTSGILASLKHTDIIAVNQYNYSEIEFIWYSNESIIFYNFVKNATFSIDFILLSDHFKTEGIFGYDYKLEKLTIQQFDKFLNKTFVYIVFRGESLCLISLK